MKKFRFQIQNCINFFIEANNVDEARIEIIDNIDNYADQMVDGSCYVSDGVEIK